ncbi:hypothetical protein ACWD01_34075 [Streptomyces sp. NPDC002835]|jgi:hypothetical protein
MSNQSVAAGVSLAGVMAHCGGSPVGAVELLVGAIASAPAAPEPYAALAELWQDRRAELKEGLEGDGSLNAVLAQAYFLFLEGDMDDAVMALGSVTGVRPDAAWGAAPWFGDARFLGAVGAEALAEACLRTLDYGHDLDAANWSLYLDLADVRAEQGDFAAAANLVEQGLEYEPHEVSLRAAAAAYRTRVSGSSDDLRALIALAPELANTTYRNLLIDYACAGPKLPRRLVAKAHRIREN